MANYTRIAPLYDPVVALLDRTRARSIADIDIRPGERVLIPGIGTGRDLAYLSPDTPIRAVDFTPAMLERAKARAAGFVDADLRVGDAMALPFAEASCDVALLHLIVAVVSDGRAALAEAARVVRPGGRAALLDKFVPPGMSDTLFRLVDPLARAVATGVAVRFEDVVGPEWEILSDEAAALFGFVRRIRLRRR